MKSSRYSSFIIWDAYKARASIKSEEAKKVITYAGVESALKMFSYMLLIYSSARVDRAISVTALFLKVLR
jgi:hypothetical protein